MKIIDITIPLSANLPVFPGDPPMNIEPVMRLASGDPANVSRISLSSHSGTHLDPPRHFSDCGTPVDQIALQVLIGDALLIEIPGHGREITRKVLEEFPIRGEERLIIKTGNSLLWDREEFCGDFSHLSVDAAIYLVESGVRLVGIDYLSIEGANGDGSVHRALLDNRVVILEGLMLDGVAPGQYVLVCLPLKISDCDGAPARAVLITRE